MADLSIEDVLAFITSEASREDLESISAAQKSRREILTIQQTATLRRGSRVRLTGISPKSIEGATGTIQDIARKRASVVFDEEQPRGVYFGRFQATYRNKMPLRVPLACLVPLDR